MIDLDHINDEPYATRRRVWGKILNPLSLVIVTLAVLGYIKMIFEELMR